MIGRVVLIIVGILALGACSLPRFPAGTVVGDGELNRVDQTTPTTVWPPVVENQTEWKPLYPNRYTDGFTLGGNLSRVEVEEDQTDE